jgi:chloride channel protein, CIC family
VKTPAFGRFPSALPRPPTPRLRTLLGGEGGLLAALALAVGVGAGVGAIGFRYLILGFTELFSGHSDPSDLGHFTNPHVPLLGPYVVLVVPILGGLLYGPLVSRFAPEARGHGVPEVMLAVHSNEGCIRARVPIVKALASALCIGSGGSVGREGPIVQIGSALGSGLGQLTRVGGEEMRLLVACGAAGGIAATFNAPIASVFFALELILRDFQTRNFGFVVLSSVVATAVGRLAFGGEAFLTLPSFHVQTAVEYPLYGLLGVIAALVGLAFIRALYGSEDLADRLWRGPAWLRPAAGGLLLGCVLLVLPEMYGVGYPVLENAIGGQYALAFLVALLAGKIVATSLTMAIGGSGGVFAPSLFMGGDARQRLRHRRPRDPARRDGQRRRLWPGRDGRGLRRGRPCPDHRRADRLRAHRRLLDHPAADAGRRDRDRPEPGHERGLDLHPEAAPARH